MKEKLVIDAEGNIIGTTGALWVLWSEQKTMGLDVIGLIPLCG